MVEWLALQIADDSQVFIFCPSDIREYVEENVEGKEIWWKEPAIVVTSQGSIFLSLIEMFVGF